MRRSSAAGRGTRSAGLIASQCRCTPQGITRRPARGGTRDGDHLELASSQDAVALPGIFWGAEQPFSPAQPRRTAPSAGPHPRTQDTVRRRTRRPVEPRSRRRSPHSGSRRWCPLWQRPSPAERGTGSAPRVGAIAPPQPPPFGPTDSPGSPLPHRRFRRLRSGPVQSEGRRAHRLSSTGSGSGGVMPWHRGPRIHRTSGEIPTPLRGDGNRTSLQTQETAFRDRTARCPPAAPVVVDHQVRQRGCRSEVEAFRQERGGFRSEAGSTQARRTNQNVSAIRQDSVRRCRRRPPVNAVEASSS